MNRLTAWVKTVIVGYRRDLTNEQMNGDACALCGHAFPGPEYRKDFGWIGLPFRRRAYACTNACTLEVVDDVAALFRKAIPARQDVWNWHLGVDDQDRADPEITAWLDAQRQTPVEIIHPGGTLTTRPLPEEYAGLIALQAQRLGYTAMIREEATAR